ncbi:protein SRC2 homolog [Abrus precatorius]|uniref:Protein SRC2 homolog n=1 Tax=Abrus precatorius TaxID=3816 RepID=A0A8B8LQ84_ABRPR|nr:protein SRC2 homolog [Abrus precatorius]
MGSRYELELKLSSARGLKNVNWRHGANRPYVVVWVDPANKLSSRVDENGDIDANWDETLVIPLPPKPLEDLTLYIDVVHAGSEEDTKPLIGSARLKLVEVLDDVGIGERASRSLTLKRPSGRPHGKVEVKVTIREPSYRAQGGYHAPPYGVPRQTASSRDYSAAPQGYGFPYGGPPQGQGQYYSAAPPAGYPYNAPPQTASYGQGYPQQTAPYGQGYPQQTAPYGQGSGYGSGYGNAAPVEEKKKSKFGGMGTGLAVGAVAGVLGGIALVEGAEYVEDKIADDVAERVEDDLGYDEGDDF